MRVAWVVPSLGLQEGQGGVDYQLVRAIAAAGHEVDVFTGSAPEAAWVLPGVRLRMLPRIPGWQLGNHLAMLASTSAALRPDRYDVIHADAGTTVRRADVVVCHTVTDRWFDLPREIRREPGLRGAHQALATRFKARLELRSARAARAVVCASRAAGEDLVARGVARERISVIPFGIDADRFRPPTLDERASARTALGVGPAEFVVAFVGAHGPRKGLPEVLDALASARPGEHLVVAGEHRGGAWAVDATARGLPVTMPGKLDDVRPAYWAADVLAYPSRYDAFGMAVLEAMACGLPVVVSRAAGAHEIVRDAGFVLDEPAPEALRAALDALRAEPARRARMGERAREIARSRTWDEPGRILLDLYERLAGATRERAPQAA